MTDRPQGPGWYDDPQYANAQRYWDGQDWTPHRQPKPISQLPPPPGLPAQPAPPPPGLPTSPYQQAPWPPPGGGPPQKSRTPKVIAAVIGVVAVLAVAGWLASPSSTNTGGDNSYNTGYDWAYRNHLNERYQAAILFSSVHDFCANNATSEAPVQGLNAQAWTRGCEDAFHKMGFGQTPTAPTTHRSGPDGTVDCSKPENQFNGHCF
jgi:hypothetical protein